MMHRVCGRSSIPLSRDRRLILRSSVARSTPIQSMRWQRNIVSQPRDEKHDTSSSSSKFKVAIVGSGPSGCYTAKYLRSALMKLPNPIFSNAGVQLDVLERLPTPFGLVRFGVAPDHPEVKNVQNDFTELFQPQKQQQENDDVIATANIHFVGNVQVGKDVSLQELREWYDIVVLAYGCESDRKLNIPGEDTLQGVLSAREFVAWYNGHPDFVHIGEQVHAATSRQNEKDPIHVVVLGHGNVALDCARILAKGASGLLDTDVASHSLDLLAQRPHRISVLGRRGHVQGAFTIKELRELTKLQEEGYGVHFTVLSEELQMGLTPASVKELIGPNGRPKTRIDKLLREAALAGEHSTSSSSSNNNNNNKEPHEIALRFLLNPVRFEPDVNDPSKLGAVVCERTMLMGDPFRQQAFGTGQFETIPAQLALVSIGYKGTVLPGLEPWFDEQRGIVKNLHGKVTSDENDPINEHGLAGLYVTGWLKRGPSGIIGTNIVDAKDTVATIIKDLEDLSPDPIRTKNRPDLVQILRDRNVQVVDWQGYERIDATETNPNLKRSEKQPREKLTTRAALLEAAFGSKQ